MKTIIANNKPPLVKADVDDPDVVSGTLLCASCGWPVKMGHDADCKWLYSSVCGYEPPKDNFF